LTTLSMLSISERTTAEVSASTAGSMPPRAVVQPLSEKCHGSVRLPGWARLGGVPSPRWTHIALPVRNVDDSIAWYTEHTPLTLVARRHDADGQSAWLADPATREAPMVLVLVAMDSASGRQPTLGPFAHLGIELESRVAVDAVADRGAAAGCLVWPCQDLPDPVGYICALSDPDGNVVEFSFDQHVEELTGEVWDSGVIAGNGARPPD
jgi:catechol 2,3-dioxygenase-like lactoylglutathione lyase family enzyme